MFRTKVIHNQRVRRGGGDGEELRKDRRAMDDEAEGARVGKPKGAAAICYLKKEWMYLRI